MSRPPGSSAPTASANRTAPGGRAGPRCWCKAGPPRGRSARRPPPDYQGRAEILRIHSRDMPLANDVELPELARITPGFVGADLAALCRESAMSALRRTFPRAVLTNGSIPTDHLLALTVMMTDFEDALKSIEPSAAREVSVDLGDR